MPAECAVSAVLFAKDLAQVAAFYREVFGASVISRGPDYEALDCEGFHLMVYQIPAAMAESIVISIPPERRERTAIRLDFPVRDLETARQAAKRQGGQIDDRPPPWAKDEASFRLGYDPEGNVIGVVTETP